VEQQVETERCAQELCQVGGHGHDLHQAPHQEGQRTRKDLATVLGQIEAGGDAQLG